MKSWIGLRPSWTRLAASYVVPNVTLAIPVPPYTRDVTDRGGEPTAKQQIEVLGLENSGEPWLDVLSSTIDQGVQFIGVCRQIVPGA